jgi:hypothetical protein
MGNFPLASPEFVQLAVETNSTILVPRSVQPVPSLLPSQTRSMLSHCSFLLLLIIFLIHSASFILCTLLHILYCDPQSHHHLTLKPAIKHSPFFLCFVAHPPFPVFVDCENRILMRSRCEVGWVAFLLTIGLIFNFFFYYYFFGCFYRCFEFLYVAYSRSLAHMLVSCPWFLIIQMFVWDYPDTWPKLLSSPLDQTVLWFVFHLSIISCSWLAVTKLVHACNSFFNTIKLIWWPLNSTNQLSISHQGMKGR